MQYVISDASGKKRYIGFDRDGKYTTVTNIQKAIIYNCKEKANNVIKNSMSVTERSKWVSTQYINENVKTKNEELQGNQTNSDLDEISLVCKISELEQFNNNLLKQKAKLEEDQSRIDLELSDVYHFIKDYKPPAHIRTKIYSIQQDVLLRREKVKKKLAYVNIMLSVFNLPSKNSPTSVSGEMNCYLTKL